MKAASLDFREITAALGYSETGGLLTDCEQAQNGTRRYLLERAKQNVKVDAVYFARDTPLVYFAIRESISPAEICNLHRNAWNDARVPLLFIITRSEVRIYDTFARPTLDEREIDDKSRLLQKLEIAVGFLKKLQAFQRSEIETGALWSKTPNHFDPKLRCDQSLLRNLRTTRKRLAREQLPTLIVQRILSRLILILYLEHREVLTASYYQKFAKNMSSIVDALDNLELTYAVFSALAEHFNGDLFPVDDEERRAVRPPHLSLLGHLFRGSDLESGQMSFWPLYDFSVIPIQLISAIHETFLRDSPPLFSPQDNTDESQEKNTDLAVGAFYSPIFLVELLMNEVLPWPGPGSPTIPEHFRILDPACGSGIFLVEAYRRLVAHWTSRSGAKPTPQELRQLMTDCIHGIDTDPGAVRIAAFSLYLALLEYLSPVSIWQRFKFPRLNRVETGKKLPNIQNRNAFVDEAPDQAETFDLIVGNPPWRRNFLPEGAEEFCKKYELPIAKEIAHAFMWLAYKKAPDGKVALLCTSKWLFNREKPDIEFRRAFLNKAYVETIINLSAMRKEQLFPGAVGPATAVIYAPKRPSALSESILYCTPKPGVNKPFSLELTIDAAELKWIPREEAETSDDVWKVLLWGSLRDLDLVRKLRSTGSALHDFLLEKKASGWISARGFQPYTKRNTSFKGTPIHDLELASMPHMAATSINRYTTDIEKLADNYPVDQFTRIGIKAAYSKPHILIKEGQSGGRFCASFLPYRCSFQDTITGISAPEKDTVLLKALTAFLNSSIASYFLFMTTSTWGVERERVKKTEVLELPDAILRNEKAVKVLAETFDRILTTDTDDKKKSLEREMDSAVADALNLSHGDRLLIHDMLTYTVDYFQRGALSSAAKKPDKDLLRKYVSAFCAVLDPIFKASKQKLTAVVYLGSPLTIVSFCRIPSSQDADEIRFESHNSLASLLSSLDELMRSRQSSTIYIRRRLKIFEKDLLHILKPFEAMLWTESAGLRDADETLVELLQGDADAR